MPKMFMFNMSVMKHMLWMMGMSNMFNNSLKTMMWISCIVNNSFSTIWFNQWIRTFYMICMPCFPCFFIITSMCIFDRISIFIIDWYLWNNIIFFIISNTIQETTENVSIEKCVWCLWEKSEMWTRSYNNILHDDLDGLHVNRVAVAREPDIQHLDSNWGMAYNCLEVQQQ